MRILILSCNTGEGHNSAARAVAEMLDRRGIEYDFEDALLCFSKTISKLVCKGHVTIYKKVPKVFGIGYRIVENHSPKQSKGKHSAMYSLLSKGSKKMYKLVSDGGYKTVISAHVFASIMLTKAMEEHPMDINTYLIATDYTCFPGVNECEVTGLFTPHPALTPDFLRFGIPEERIIPSGIPVRQAFFGEKDAAAAREKLGLPQDKKIVLLSCGSMGCGPIKKLAKQIMVDCSDDVMVVAICGTNQKLYRKLEKVARDHENLKVIGFTKDMPLYMDAADMAVTKPGGLSSTEAATKGLPLIFIDAVPGCETYNLAFFTENGFAETNEEISGIVALVKKFAENDELRREMSARLRENFDRNGAEIICDRMIKDAETAGVL